MHRGNKLFLGILLGAISLAAIFCIAVGIGCSINGITFGEQIAQWFGSNAPVVEETVETIVETPVA